MEKVLRLLNRLRKEKFTGMIILFFNQGGVRGMKEAIFLKVPEEEDN